MIKVTVDLDVFAQLEQQKLDLELPKGSTVNDLLDYLVSHGEMGAKGWSRDDFIGVGIRVNKKLIPNESELSDGAQIRFKRLLSGG